MAITDGRSKVSNVTELVDTKFISAIDRTKDQLPNTTDAYKPLAASSKLAAKVGKRNLFSMDVPLDPGNNMISISAFPADGNPACTGGGGTNKSPPDDRLITADNKDTKCPSMSNTSLVMNTVLSHMIAGLPDSKVVAIEAMLGSQLTKHSRATRHLGGANKDASVLRGVSSVSKALSDVGSTLKDKSNLKSLLGCIDGSGLNGNESTMIINIVISGLLAQALCISVNKMLDTIVDLVALGTSVKGNVVRGVIDSFVGAKNRSASNKVAILSTLPGLIGQPSVTDTAITAGSSGKFMKSLSSGVPNTQNMGKEHADSEVALSSIDPNWNKDPTGKPNLSRTKGNKYLAALNEHVVKSSVTPVAAIPTEPVALSPADPRYNALLVMAANANKTVVTNGNQLSAGY